MIVINKIYNKNIDVSILLWYNDLKLKKGRLINEKAKMRKTTEN